jgi:hypothetical protein
MYRLLSLSTLILASLAAQAEAIEMFTNFHNGENVGFPPMQVPIAVYGGWGRGGWNPRAEGMPLKTWPPVPAMTPTQQIPGGFRSLNQGAGCNVQTRNGDSADAQSYNASANGLTRNTSSRIGFEETLVSERRHGNRWRDNGSRPQEDGENVQNRDTVHDVNANQNIGSQPKQEPTLASPPVTILHAEEGKPPISSEGAESGIGG